MQPKETYDILVARFPQVRFQFVDLTDLSGGANIEMSYQPAAAPCPTGDGLGIWPDRAQHYGRPLEGDPLGAAIKHVESFIASTDAFENNVRQGRADTERRKQNRQELPVPKKQEGWADFSYVVVEMNWEGRSYAGPWQEDVQIALDAIIEHATGPIRVGGYDVGIVFVATAADDISFFVRNGLCTKGSDAEDNENLDEMIEAADTVVTTRQEALDVIKQWSGDEE